MVDVHHHEYPRRPPANLPRLACTPCGSSYGGLVAEVFDLAEIVSYATTAMRTYSPGEEPDLYPIGVPEVDDMLGGFSPGTLVVLGMDTGVGKSRFALMGALEAARRGCRHGIISTEDPADVVGLRALASLSNVNSMRIRRKAGLTAPELRRMKEAESDLEKGFDGIGPEMPVFAFGLGASLPRVLEHVEDLANKGAKVIWLDYLQKVRGVSENRRNEVGQVLSAFQGACGRRGVVPVVISQLARRDGSESPGNGGEKERQRVPRRWHLKESGDIENEARVIILGWTHDNGKTLHFRLDKSTFGGEGTNWIRVTGTSGMLVRESEDEKW